MELKKFLSEVILLALKDDLNRDIDQIMSQTEDPSQHSVEIEASADSHLTCCKNGHNMY